MIALPDKIQIFPNAPHNYTLITLILVLLFSATPSYGSDISEPSWWFNGTWYPLSRSYAGDGIFKISGSTLTWGFQPTLYALEEIPLSNFSHIDSIDVVVLRATPKQKPSDGIERPLGEKKAYLVIRHYGLDLSVHVCGDFQQIQKDIDKNTNNYCSTGAFSRNKEEMWSQ